MQGRDGEPPEAVRACGHAGGNIGGVGCRWLERLQLEEEEKEAICRGERDVHGGLLQMQWWLAGGLGNTWWCWLLKAELEEETLTAEEAEEEGLQRGEVREEGEERDAVFALPLVNVCWCRRKVSVVDMVVGRPMMVCCQWLQRWREKEKQKNRESGRNREKADFLAYFGPDFPLPQAIKSTSIYRRWKREILSTLEKNFSP